MTRISDKIKWSGITDQEVALAEKGITFVYQENASKISNEEVKKHMEDVILIMKRLIHHSKGVYQQSFSKEVCDMVVSVEAATKELEKKLFLS